MAVILPPKIYHYEPKIYGFKIAGKRGSKYFDPPLGNVKYVYESMTGIDKEKLNVKKPVLTQRQNRFVDNASDLKNQKNNFMESDQDMEDVLK